MKSLKSLITEARPALLLIYLSIMGFLCILSTQKYLGIPVAPVNCLTFMGIIFGIYTLNRFTDTEEDFTNDLGRLLFFQRKSTFLYIAVSSLAISIGILIFIQKLNWMHLLLLAMGSVYSYRMIPWYSRSPGFRLLRIKEMTFVKNLAVSFLWSSSVFIVPVLYSGAARSNMEMTYLLACGLFISTLNNTLFDDIMDEPGDRVAGIKTLPTAWGIRNSGILLVSLDCIWLAAVGALRVMNAIDTGHAAFLAFLGLYPFLYLGLYFRTSTSKSVLDLLSESDLLFFSFGMMILSRL